MSSVVTRRDLLTGRGSGDPASVLRPPGAHLDQFAALCTRCGDCVTACPEGVLAADERGLPEVRFDAAACTFCGACAEACESGALTAALVKEWPWRAHVTAACFSLNGISCRICQDACDADAIRFRLQLGGRAEPILDGDACTGCGACAHACPASAIAFTHHGDAHQAAPAPEGAV